MGKFLVILLPLPNEVSHRPLIRLVTLCPPSLTAFQVCSWASYLSGAQFPHLLNGNDDGPYFTRYCGDEMSWCEERAASGA